MSNQKVDSDELDSIEEHEITPYFQVIDGNERSSSGVRRGSCGQSQSREEATMSSKYGMASLYHEILGRDEGSYCWYRLEHRGDDENLDEGESTSKPAKREERKRSAFFEKSGAWMQKYVTGIKKQSDTSSSKSSSLLPDETSCVKAERSDMSLVNVMTSIEAVEKLDDTTSTPSSDLEGKVLEHQTCRQGVTKSNPLKHGEQRTVEDSRPDINPGTDRRAMIHETLGKFQMLWEHYEYEPDAAGQPKRRRPDMRAAAYMREMKWTLEEDIIGEVEGVEVGDSFSWRAEMSVIGLHKELVAGINVVKRPETEGGPVATSVVFGISSNYSDNIYKESGSEPSIYSGEGGLPSTRGSSTKEPGSYKDQTLTGGNLALKRSSEQKIPIRVIRGVDKKVNKDDKKYVYDGLYEIIDWMFDTGVHGNKVYKFVLNRLAGLSPSPATTAFGSDVSCT